MVKLYLIQAAICINTISAFAPISSVQTQKNVANLSMSPSEQQHEEKSRRSFLNKVVGSTAIAAFSLLQNVTPANAIGGGIKKVNTKLASYGLPTMEKVADGFTPLAEVWGRGKNRDPLMISFAHPSDWVVTLPSQDVNGEDGTIQAGEYAKGDTATLFIYEDEGKVENINEQPKTFFEKVLIKSISQKGNNVFQDFKVTKIVPKTENGQEYMVCDFKYTLITGAGFEVDRIGVASVTSTGNYVETLWTASTRQRYQKTQLALREIASSFRCYSEGLGMTKIEYTADIV
mmetsp:Transcript_24543/g.30183  ORF Transcript_24543/g.30183 Transcript_24543/m.30183 type:complete len:289 (+) Transcript_24543:146-1012(+)